MAYRHSLFPLLRSRWRCAASIAFYQVEKEFLNRPLSLFFRKHNPLLGFYVSNPSCKCRLYTTSSTSENQAAIQDALECLIAGCSVSGKVVEEILAARMKILCHEDQGGLTNHDPNQACTTEMYDRVLSDVASSGTLDAAETAQAILCFFLKNYYTADDGFNRLSPRISSVNTVLDAWARSGDQRAPSQAEEILRTIEILYEQGNRDLQPNVGTYNAVINAWAKSGQKSSPSRVEHILVKMKLRAQRDSFFRPDTVTYNTVLNALAKSGERGAAERAETFLIQWLERYNEGHEHVKPDAISFNTPSSTVPSSIYGQRKEEVLQLRQSV